MNKNKTKSIFTNIYINNRWTKPYFRRDENWLIFGIYRRQIHPKRYGYIIGIFGVELRILFDIIELEK